ncbi:hypothetical protein ACFYKX_03490 [Cytobacillus sp. FJAT-54145]|uniref:DUF5673 domain-containing protein n=1 Tax=Cytobacillus spartinae TaxID=3299023 RepID=A0ABW6K7H5_9BACI
MDGFFNITAKVFFIFLFISTIYILIRNRVSLKKAAESSKDAIFPSTTEEYSRILIPNEWKEMIPLSKDTKSYKYVHWGTIIATIFLTALIGILIFTDFIDSSSFFNIAYVFFLVLLTVKHRGNLFILPQGLILNGKYYTIHQIKHYEVEQIVRWHTLYGLDSRVDNGYKLTISLKSPFANPLVVVVEDYTHLEKIVKLLHEKGIAINPKSEQALGEKEKEQP